MSYVDNTVSLLRDTGLWFCPTQSTQTQAGSSTSQQCRAGKSVLSEDVLSRTWRSECVESDSGSEVRLNTDIDSKSLEPEEAQIQFKTDKEIFSSSSTESAKREEGTESQIVRRSARLSEVAEKEIACLPSKSSSSGDLSSWRRNAISPSELPPCVRIPPEQPEFELKEQVSNKCRRRKMFAGYLPCRSNSKELLRLYRLAQNRHQCSQGRSGRSTRSGGTTDHAFRRRTKTKECKRKAAVRSVLKDMCDSVVLQPVVQHLRSRIRKLTVPGRPVPNTVDPVRLGAELKLRLAVHSADDLLQNFDEEQKLKITKVELESRSVMLYRVDWDQNLKPTSRYLIKFKPNITIELVVSRLPDG